MYGVLKGEERVATVEVGQNNGKVFVVEMRGPCNAMLPKPIETKLLRWAGEKDKWTLPVLAGPTANPFDTELF
jgi:hypothetical protein